MDTTNYPVFNGIMRISPNGVKTAYISHNSKIYDLAIMEGYSGGISTNTHTGTVDEANRPIDKLTHTMYAAVKDDTERLLCIVDARTEISNQGTYEGFAYLADNTNIDALSINSLSIIDNKLYGLTSDSKLVIISDLHKTTANYSVTHL